jgi:DNA mismatch repair protein MutS
MRFALAWIDISTGEFRLAERNRASLAAEIARLEPSEIIVSDALYGDPELGPYLRSLSTVRPLTRDVFDGSTAEHRLATYFGLATTEGFGALSRLELTAAAACVGYVERTQLGQHPPLSPPMRESEGSTLLIDQATRANLELARTLSGERRGSLLAAIDRSVTAAGSRLLAQRLAAPLTDPQAIGARHDAVEFFVSEAEARADLRARLKAAPDISRALARLVVERGGPRDLAAVRDGILAASALAAELVKFPALAAELTDAVAALRRPEPALAAKLAAALADDLPHLKRDGAFVRAGYDRALDEARALRDESRRVIATLQARYAEATAVRALKIRHNNVLGYFVEVTAQHGDKLMAAPLNATFSTPPSSIARRSPARCASPRPSLESSRPRLQAPASARWPSSWRPSTRLRAP